MSIFGKISCWIDDVFYSELTVFGRLVAFLSITIIPAWFGLSLNLRPEWNFVIRLIGSYFMGAVVIGVGAVGFWLAGCFTIFLFNVGYWVIKGGNLSERTEHCLQIFTFSPLFFIKLVGGDWYIDALKSLKKKE